jgi:hypothetical protein
MTQLFQFEPKPDTAIVCDLTDAPDTFEERLAEYARLRETALVARQRTTNGMILTFAQDDGVAAWVADLGAREAACCPFMRFDITANDTEIRWETSGTAEMQPILDEYYAMFDDVTSLSPDELANRFTPRIAQVDAAGPARNQNNPAWPEAAG